MIVLFLYTEIASYTEACFRALSAKAELHVVRYPLNKEAPFAFSSIPNCTFYDRWEYDTIKLEELCKRINPDLLLVSGWGDKVYLSVAKLFRKEIPVILTMDNYWQGTWKQHLLCIVSPSYLKRIFTHIWVPGRPQVAYAKKLGFNDTQIKTGFYSADVDLYNAYEKSFRDSKANNYPKRFLYVGRYVGFKNIQLMCEAFIEALKAKDADWELWCIGTGELWEQRIEHPQIRHIGFVQPRDMGPYIEQTGVFVLPSLIENWGVVVHEFAAAGFPLVCSSGVGAASEFLQINRNGFLFNPHKKEELIDVFNRIMSMPKDKLIQMGKISQELARSITPQTWVDTILTFKS